MFLLPRQYNCHQFHDKQPSIIPEKKEIEKYAKSGLKDTDAEQLHKKLNEYMQLEKPYLNSELSLSKLGKVLVFIPITFPRSSMKGKIRISTTISMDTALMNLNEWLLIRRKRNLLFWHWHLNVALIPNLLSTIVLRNLPIKLLPSS